MIICKYVCFQRITNCLLLFTFSLSLFAQSDVEWYPIGSSMCFEGGTWKYTIEKDTIIADRTWKVLAASIHPSDTPPSEIELYVAETDDVVEMYWNEMIITLFDFNALPGDTIHVIPGLATQEFMNSNFSLFPFSITPNASASYPDTLRLNYIIDEVDSIEINGHTRRIQKSNSQLTFLPNWLAPTTILEGIGGLNGLFGFRGVISLGAVIPVSQFSHYCFENDYFSMAGWEDFISGTDCTEFFDCEPIISGLDIEPSNAEFEYHFIVTENLLDFNSTNPAEKEIAIYNSSGQLILRSPKFFSHHQVDLSHLVRGLYIVTWINNGERKMFSRKIMKL